MQGGPGLPPVPALLLLPSVCLCLLSAPASTYPCACLYPLGPAACARLYVSVPVCVSLCLPIPTPCAYLYVPTSASCACFLHSPPILLLLANSRSLKFPTQPSGCESKGQAGTLSCVGSEMSGGKESCYLI